MLFDLREVQMQTLKPARGLNTRLDERGTLMSDERVTFSHPLPAGLEGSDVDRFAEHIAEELSARGFEKVASNKFRFVFFDVNVDHDVEFSVVSEKNKALVSGTIGLDKNSSTNKAYFSNAAWGLIGLAVIVGLIADSIWWGIGAAVVIALIDQASSSGEGQKTRALVIDAINRSYIKV